MYKKILITSVLAITLMLVAGCGDGDDGVAGAQRSLGAMQGIIISIVDDAPIPYATLEIWSQPIETLPPEDRVGGEIKVDAVADDQGHYDVAVPVGRIWIRANAAGYKRSPPQQWALSRDNTGELNFVLYPGEGDMWYSDPGGFDINDEYDDKEAFDPCFPGFEREGPHDDRQCGEG